jgi:two-component system, OmpR family, phosphate regulon response regulator PhoB
MNNVACSRVLIVDDDQRVRTVVSWQLEAEGFAVTEAADGAAALAQIEHDPPDLVVLDLSCRASAGSTSFAGCAVLRGPRPRSR